MAPPKPKAKSVKAHKEKVFHPQSRKAGQLVRTQVRKAKLTELAKTRSKRQGSQVDLYSFFYHAMPPEGGVLALEDLHTIIKDVWLTRHDGELEEERAQRRKGRPKSTKEQKLEEVKLRESEEYRTGLEVIDLTDHANVELFRQWDQKEAAFVQQLRFIRISSSSPETFAVSRPGIHPSLKKTVPSDDQLLDRMDTDEAPILLEPTSRFASTIATMDGPL